MRIINIIMNKIKTLYKNKIINFLLTYKIKLIVLKIRFINLFNLIFFFI